MGSRNEGRSAHGPTNDWRRYDKQRGEAIAAERAAEKSVAQKAAEAGVPLTQAQKPKSGGKG